MQLNIRALSAAEAAATPERRRPPRDDARGGEHRDGSWQKRPGSKPAEPKPGFDRRPGRPEGGAGYGGWERDRPKPGAGARREERSGAAAGKPFPRSPGAAYSAGKPRKRRDD